MCHDSSVTKYNRLARETPGFEHWRLPVAAIIAAAAFGVFNLVLAFVLILLSADAAESMTEISLGNPGILFVQLGSIAVLLPCVLIAIWAIWPKHLGYLHSVEGRFRWRWFASCFALALLIVGAFLGFWLGGAASSGEPVEFSFASGGKRWSLLVVVLVVPFQAAAEEYVFRGALMQLISSWTRRTWVPVLVTTALFAAGHLYNFWGLMSVAVFGLVAALVTLRTGGLEAAVALHIVNNLLLMSLDLFGLADSSGEGADFFNEVLPTVFMCLALWAAVEWLARRRGLQTTRERIEPVEYVVVPPPPYVPVGHPLAGHSHTTFGTTGQKLEHTEKKNLDSDPSTS